MLKIIRRTHRDIRDLPHPRKQGITDLGLAPGNASGKVEFSADFAMLQSANFDPGNRRILFDGVNRGMRIGRR